MWFRIPVWSANVKRRMKDSQAGLWKLFKKSSHTKSALGKDNIKNCQLPSPRTWSEYKSYQNPLQVRSTATFDVFGEVKTWQLIIQGCFTFSWFWSQICWWVKYQGADTFSCIWFSEQFPWNSYWRVMAVWKKVLKHETYINIYSWIDWKPVMESN